METTKTITVGKHRKHTIRDLTGMTFGELTVIERNSNDPRQKRTYWWCSCSCGQTVSIKGEYLKTGRSKSCGCMKQHYDRSYEFGTYVVEPGVRIENMIGRKSGELMVIGFSHKEGKHAYWNCQCTCGRILAVRSDNIIDKATRTCGCATGIRGLENGLIVAPGQRVRDFTGHRFGKLVALNFSHTSRGGADVWLCQCSCGSQTLVESRRMNRIRTCGCQRGYMNKNSYDWHVIKDGIKIPLRSSYEVIYAQYLIRNNILFEYEPKRFTLRPGVTYVPDFYLPDQNQWVELRGHQFPGAMLKLELFEQVTRNKLLVILDSDLAKYLPGGLSYWQWIEQNKRSYLK